MEQGRCGVRPFLVILARSLGSKNPKQVTKNQNTEHTGKPSENVLIFATTRDHTSTANAKHSFVLTNYIFVMLRCQSMVGWIINQFQSPLWRSSRNNGPEREQMPPRLKWQKSFFICRPPLCQIWQPRRQKPTVYNVKPSFLVRTSGYDICQTHGHFRLEITSNCASEFEQVLVPKKCFKKIKIQIRTCLNNDVSEKIKLGGGKGSGRLGGFWGVAKTCVFLFFDVTLFKLHVTYKTLLMLQSGNSSNLQNALDAMFFRLYVTYQMLLMLLSWIFM